ncbi:MAG: hypothetical protein HPY83_12560 [Anaerolineae bacterium]|nr:hypothetical protein [Anaerolineae bacterium]
MAVGVGGTGVDVTNRTVPGEGVAASTACCAVSFAGGERAAMATAAGFPGVAFGAPDEGSALPDLSRNPASTAPATIASATRARAG